MQQRDQAGECGGAKNQGAYGGNGRGHLRQGNCKAEDGARMPGRIQRDGVIAKIDVEGGAASNRRPRLSSKRRDNLGALAVVFHRFRIVAGIRQHNAAAIDERDARSNRGIGIASPLLEIFRRICGQRKRDDAKGLRHLLLNQRPLTFRRVTGEQEVGACKRDAD